MSLPFKVYVGLLLLIVSVGHVFAQQSPHPEIEWYKSFFNVKEQKNIEEAFNKANARLKHAQEFRDLEEEARASKEVGLLNLIGLHDYQKAMDSFIRSLTIEDSLGLTKERIFTYFAIAQVFEEVGDYPKSSEFLEQALQLNRTANNEDANILVLALNKLGKINASMGKMEEAFGSYQQVLNYKDDIEQPEMEAEALFNLGLLYAKEGKHQEAMRNHKSALALRRSIADRGGEAKSLNDIGELYTLMKNDERALANHVAALEIRQAMKDKKGTAESYNNVGVFYFQQKNFDRAIANLELGLEAARESQAQEQIRKSSDYLTQCHKAQGDYKKALEYSELFIAISDFIQSEKNELRLAETQNRYELDKKQLQIERLESIRSQREKELREQKKFRNVLIALVALGFIVVVLVLYSYIVKRKANRELQELNATKDKFFSIISHDLKGPLNSFTSFSSLLISHTDSLTKDEIRMLAQDLDKSLKNLFALLENLLEWSRSQTGNIDFTPEVFDLAKVLEQNAELLRAQAQNKNISIGIASAVDFTIQAHKHSVYTVVRNLISNAIKFTPQGGKITLNAISLKNEIVVSVADTGVGMKPEVVEKLFRIDTKHTTKGTANEKGTGLGLILCKEFIEKNGGRIWVESEEGKGSVFYFTLVPAKAKLKEDAVTA